MSTDKVKREACAACFTVAKILVSLLHLDVSSLLAPPCVKSAFIFNGLGTDLFVLFSNQSAPTHLGSF